MDGVIEMANVDYPYCHTNEGDDLEAGQSEACLRYNLEQLEVLKFLQHD